MLVKCRAIGCDCLIPPRLFMCSRHIKLVPVEFRKVVMLHNRDGRVAAAGQSYAALAVRIVRGKEGK